jgi:hypothetical protein
MPGYPLARCLQGAGTMRPTANRPWQEEPAKLFVQTDSMLGAARVLHQAGAGVTDDPRIAHLCLDAGQSRILLRGAGTTSDRVIARWLIATFAFACVAAILMQSESRPTLATEQMERLAAQLERSASIPAQRADAIARALEQPLHCAPGPCDVEAQARNKAVREHLKHLLATKEIAAKQGTVERVAGSPSHAGQLIAY